MFDISINKSLVIFRASGATVGRFASELAREIVNGVTFSPPKVTDSQINISKMDIP